LANSSFNNSENSKPYHAKILWVCPGPDPEGKRSGNTVLSINSEIMTECGKFWILNRVRKVPDKVKKNSGER
jgi:hypothetical protein